MRLYDIVSGILLIPLIVDFVHAVPISVQDECQTSIDVAHIPKDSITGLGKRVDLPWGKYLNKLKAAAKPKGSSDTQASNLAPPEPGSGSTNILQAPVRNPASSTPNSGLLMEPFNPPLGPFPVRPAGAGSGNPVSGNNFQGPLFTPGSSGLVGDHGVTEAHTLQPNPNSGPSTDNFNWDHSMKLDDSPSKKPAPAPPTDNFDWAYWMKMDDPPPQKPAGTSSKWGNWLSKSDRPGEPTVSKSPKLSNTISSIKSGLSKINWDQYINLLDHLDPLPRPKPPNPAPLKPLNLGLSDPGPSNRGPSNPRLTAMTPGSLRPLRFGPANLGPTHPAPDNDVVSEPPPTPAMIDPEPNSGYQSSSTVTSPDLAAAIYAAKGKAKQSRSISSTARFNDEKS